MCPKCLAFRKTWVQSPVHKRGREREKLCKLEPGYLVPEMRRNKTFALFNYYSPKLMRKSSSLHKNNSW
jgi:hypothetical protein